MIPKIIHQFYREDSDSVKRMRTIKNHNKGWIHKSWSLDQVKKLSDNLPPGYKDFSQKFEKFIQNEMWELAEEVARFLILYSEGGFFIDSGFRLVEGKKLRDIPFGDNELVLFNGLIRSPNTWRIQNNVLACSKGHKFMLHLMAYVGNMDYLPICPWSGKVLEVYSSTYITTQYSVYMSLWNGTAPIKNSISHIMNTDKIKMLEKEVVLNPHFTFLINPSMVIKHNAISQQLVRSQ